jgi:tetratricopeptide (TPR) repeat protein
MNDKDFERIESYLSGHMSKEERAFFEAELAQKEDLASAFALYQSIEKSMRSRQQESVEEATLKQSLKELGALYFSPNPEAQGGEGNMKPAPSQIADKHSTVPAEREGKPKAIPVWVKLALAAGITGIMVLGIWYFQQKNEGAEKVVKNEKQPAEIRSVREPDTSANKQFPDASVPGDSSMPSSAQGDKADQAKTHPGKAEREALYARYFSPDTVPANRNEYLDEGLGFYADGNYAKAADALEDIAAAPLTRGETTEEALTIFYAQYYQGISYLASGKASKAIAILQKTSINNSSLQAKADWYLALAFIKAGRTAEADQVLSNLAQNKTSLPFRQKASSLQKELREN